MVLELPEALVVKSGRVEVVWCGDLSPAVRSGPRPAAARTRWTIAVRAGEVLVGLVDRVEVTGVEGTATVVIAGEDGGGLTKTVAGAAGGGGFDPKRSPPS